MLVANQIGWMKCVACSDYKRKQGMMWMGGNEFMPCPACNGTGKVPKLQYLDVSTGREIDYEQRRT